MNNHDLERAVLATMLQNPLIADEKGVILDISYFSDERNKLIFKVINDLKNSNKDYGSIMVKSYLKLHNMLNSIGEHYFDSLLQMATFIHDFVSCVEHLQELATRRAINDICYQSSQDVLNMDKNVSDLLNNTLSVLNNTQVSAKNTALNGEQIANRIFENIQKTINGDNQSYIKTGYYELDSVLFKKKDLIYIAGRPSMGKSTLLQNLFMYLSQTAEGVAVFFNIEMSSDEISMRLASAIGTINLSSLMGGSPLTEQDWVNLTDSVSFIKDSPIYIDDNSDVSVAYIRSTLNKITQETGKPISGVFVDYIGIMQEVRTADNKQQALERVSNGLKQVAKDFDTPVFCLAQLNRNLETRPNKRPMMSDLRDSGALEQDADKILFIYRDEVYNKNSNDKGIAEIIIGKNRNGEKNTIRLGFQGQYSRFSNLTQDYYNQMNEYKNTIPFS